MKKRKQISIFIVIFTFSLLLIAAAIVPHFRILQAPISKHSFRNNRIECVYQLKYDKKIVYEIDNIYYLVDEYNNVYSKVIAGKNYMLTKVSKNYMVFETPHGIVAMSCQHNYVNGEVIFEKDYDKLNVWEAWKLQEVTLN